MPEFYDVKWVKKVTDVKGVKYGMQKMPWPLAHRELMFHVTGSVDYKNKALMSLSKSKKNGETYFGYEVPDERYEHPRIKVNMGYNFFQWVGPKKTRHI